MNPSNEDELVESLTWSDQSYTLAEFVDENSLPQVVRVVRGHDGGLDSTTLGYGEILTLHALKATKKLKAEDGKGHEITISLDCSYKVQVLPELKDSKYNGCRVEDLQRIYPKAKYLQVLRAHYGSGEGDESTTKGEMLEIVNIDKRHKKAKVKNLETNQTFTLSSNCTAEFRPLLDWRSYCVKDLKSQFGFPVRVRFLATECQTKTETMEESLRLLAQVSDVTVVEEIEDVSVITTTACSNVELKFCYEIPKHLEVKVAVAEGFLNGEKAYQEVSMTLDKGFDVSKMINRQQVDFIEHRDTIKEYNYESITDLFLNISRQGSMEDTKEDIAPVLPPRKSRLSTTKSVPLTTPLVPQKPTKIKRAISTKVTDGSKPAITPRPITRPRSESTPVEPWKISKIPPKTPLNIPANPKNASKAPFKLRPEPPLKLSSSPLKDSSNFESVRSVPSTQLPPRQPKVAQSASNFPVVNKSEKIQTPSVLASESTTTTPKLRSQPAKIRDDTEGISPGPSTNASKPRMNDAKTSQNTPPLPSLKPLLRPLKIPDGATAVLSQLSLSPPGVPKSPSNSTVSKLRESSSTLSIKQDSQSRDSEYAEPVVVFGAKLPSSEQTGNQRTYSKGVYEELQPLETQRHDENPFYQPLNMVNTTATSSHGDNIHGSHLLISEGSKDSEPGNENPYAVVARIPLDLSRLTVNEVSQLLKNLRMECYMETFEQEMIDGNLLKNLQEDDLQYLNVSSFHIKKLIKFINGWRPKQ